MQTADNSNSARITRLKQNILGGSSKRSTNFKDYSILQSQNLGRSRYIHQTPGGRVEDIPCICDGPSVPSGPSGQVKVDIVLNNSGNNDCFIAKYNPDGTVLWAARIAGIAGDEGYSVATDSANNILVTGYYEGDPITVYNANGTVGATLENSSDDCFIAKYSSSGTVLWATRIADNNITTGYSIATDAANNILVTGKYYDSLTLYNAGGSSGATLVGDNNRACFVAKYNSSGTVQWARRIENGNQVEGYGITTDASNNVLVTGSYSVNTLNIYGETSVDKTLTNSGNNDTFIVKYSSSGTVLWATRIAGSEFDYLSRIATDASNNILVTGYYSSNPLTIYNEDGSDGPTLSSDNNNSCFVAKYSSSGVVQWAAHMDGVVDDNFGIATNAANNILVTGTYDSPLTIYNADTTTGATLDNSGRDCFVAKYSSSGSVLWATRIAGSGSDGGYSIATDAASNVLVTGYYSSNTLTVHDASGGSYKTLAKSGSDDCFVAKYSSSGTVLWAAQIAGSGDDYGNGIATDAANNVLVTGSYNSNPLTVYYAR